jgi:hypothetical protein
LSRPGERRPGGNPGGEEWTCPLRWRRAASGGGSPVVSAVSVSAAPDLPTAAVVITGSRLSTAIRVTSDGVAVPFTQVSDTQITALFAVEPGRPVNVQVTTAAGTSGGTGSPASWYL